MKGDRFIPQRLQFSKKFGKFELWGIYDTTQGNYLLFGSKEQIIQPCKILNIQK